MLGCKTLNSAEIPAFSCHSLQKWHSSSRHQPPTKKKNGHQEKKKGRQKKLHPICTHGATMLRVRNSVHDSGKIPTQKMLTKEMEDIAPSPEASVTGASETRMPNTLLSPHRLSVEIRSSLWKGASCRRPCRCDHPPPLLARQGRESLQQERRSELSLRGIN